VYQKNPPSWWSANIDLFPTGLGPPHFRAALLAGLRDPFQGLTGLGGRMPHGEIAQRDDSDQARLSSRRICMSAMFAESSSRSIVFEAVLDLLRHDFSHLDVRSLEEVSCECFGRIAAQEAPDGLDKAPRCSIGRE
jgi:hypothetical protein